VDRTAALMRPRVRARESLVGRQPIASVQLPTLSWQVVAGDWQLAEDLAADAFAKAWMA